MTLGRYDRWLVAHVLRAYLILLLGVALAFIFTLYRTNASDRHITEVAMVSCEAGNQRSQITKEDLIDSQKRLEQLDLEKLLGIPPEQVEEVRRISKESNDRRIARLPYVDCKTGKQISP